MSKRRLAALTARGHEAEDEYIEVRLLIATFLRAHRREFTDKQWRQVLRFWELRGDSMELSPELTAP